MTLVLLDFNSDLKYIWNEMIHEDRSWGCFYWSFAVSISLCVSLSVGVQAHVERNWLFTGRGSVNVCLLGLWLNVLLKDNYFHQHNILYLNHHHHQFQKEYTSAGQFYSDSTMVPKILYNNVASAML